VTAPNPRAAAQIATALGAFVAQARRDGITPEPEVIVFGRLFAAAATARQDTTERASCSCDREAEPVIELLTVPQVARVLGLSSRSVERRLSSGELPSVELAGPKVKRADLTRYIESLPPRRTPGAAAAAENAAAAAPIRPAG
jgi:excisionase family DNA binding protein